MGSLYTSATLPVVVDVGQRPMESYEIMGEVTGRSVATNILGLIAIGDAGVSAAYNDALKHARGANGLIDVRVDYKSTSILGLIATYETIVTGVAVRYKY
jgi:uncharacterized protein YbjQ (UPF0145 family)